jgi:sulfate adenylyltransferase
MIRNADYTSSSRPNKSKGGKSVNGKRTPFGGRLVNRMLNGEEAAKIKVEAADLPKIAVSSDQIITLEMIATGVLSPNEGFMGQEDYESVLERGRMASGLPWTLPPTLAPKGGEDLAKGLERGERLAITDGEGNVYAVMEVKDKFRYDKEKRAERLFGTTDRRHPGVDNIYRNMGEFCLGGPIWMLGRPGWGPFERYRLEPADTWRIFEERGWKTIVAFQTANPIHRGHEYLQKCALEIFDGLFIHPVVETTRKAYFRNEFRLYAYQVALKNYYPQDRVLMAPLRVVMNYAGPKEAILHAIIRRNFGCTHFIVGRDHAGVGNFYDPYAAQRIFDEYEAGELGIEPLFFQESYYCARCGNVATAKTCPHGENYRIGMSGTGIQDILRYGYIPPKEVMRPEVVQIALQGIQPKGVGSDGRATRAPGETVKGLFPYYLGYHRLGGNKREKKREPSELGEADLEAALSDARQNATRIYGDIYEEFAHSFDISRDIADEHRNDAQAAAIEAQEGLVEILREKMKASQEQVSDPFMYQDKAEAQRELEVADKILDSLPKPIPADEFKERIWNPLDYEDYVI